MPTLPKDLRGKLEKAVLAAREEATKGGRAALIALGVGDGKKPGHLDKDGEALRRRLRARGRQAGDVLKADDSQKTDHLVQECAYEHWHRMLFARFLAENELLRHPEWGVAVSLEECEELARDEGLDRWELAARFAQHMLPEVFRQDDPVLQLRLPTEARNKLTAILNELPTDVFTADDSLGWTYQFWQTKRKKEVNESGVKIGADEISPVTQLFTEDYMVEFLLHNTLGAWWAGKLGPIEAASEEEARAKASLPERDGIGITWTYLRFVQDEETRTWSPAAGTFDGWPREAKGITFLDPCMGSGHFPVFALPILARLRMEEEGLEAADAVCAVLRDNIHGLELDPRCCQIGAFNLALTAWKLAGYQVLPPLHIACCGLAPRAKKEDWLKLAERAAAVSDSVLAPDTDLLGAREESLLSQKLKSGMERLYRLFEKAPVLGSLLNPRVGGGDLLEAGFQQLQPLLEKALAQEAGDDAAHEMAVTARGLAKAAEILAGQFTLVATNVPYLGRGKQNEVIQDYCDRFHPDAKFDLATSFIERSVSFCDCGGTSALVTPQAVLFLNAYKKLRNRLLGEQTWRFVVRLGARAFETITGEVVNVSLLAVTRRAPNAEQLISGLDVSDESGPKEKQAKLSTGVTSAIRQRVQLANPDSRISFEENQGGDLLNKYASTATGMQTFDLPRFLIKHWEVQRHGEVWLPSQSTVEATLHYGGLCDAVRWENGRGDLFHYMEDLAAQGYRSGIWKAGSQFWGKSGVVVSLMGDLPTTLYLGLPFNQNAGVLVPSNPKNQLAVWCFCESGEMGRRVRAVDQSLKVTNATVGKIPFDLAHWQKVAAEKYPDGLPKPFSSDPTQWLFNGHPLGSDQSLHVAVARLLGYQWPRQTGSTFPDCPALEADGLERFADEDGIVCLTSLRGEANAADRVHELLGEALGTYDQSQLIAAAGTKGSKSKTLEDWLRDEFFAQHCELFQSRPFIWHLWDGRKDGFHALVNYHKLAGAKGAGRRTLEALTHGYLNDWITRQRAAVNDGEAGADDRLAAALELHGVLENILAGEPPYDLFIRWKPLHQQPIGWEPDLNDGVRLNARPFLATDLSRGSKGAGLFRAKVNIQWKKDRGNEPAREKEDFPWFWTWDEKTQDFAGGGKFDGNRWNDLHYTTAFKQAARDRKPISS
ncbi:MAG: hypothetical protein JNJ70_12995 [Verrucomicrobiales bacterium]|nr:hypothetical protein [Verrucomicrobiales bacterium]